jgi:FkbM family methyltransferase
VRERLWRLGLLRPAGERVMDAFARAYPAARFIEVGANDGGRGSLVRDRVIEGEWTGVMMEPAPPVFARLRTNYEGVQGVALENAAIADHDGDVEFHYLEPVEGEARDEAWWAGAVGSLSRDQLLASAGAEIEGRIVSTRVPCWTFASLCRRHALAVPDLLVVDAEGFDDRIVAQVELGSRRPRLIVYEHLHLDTVARDACRERLRDAGYLILEEFFDTFCLDRKADDELVRRFRRLRPVVPPVYGG